MNRHIAVPLSFALMTIAACAPPGETVDLQAEIAALREAAQAYNAAAESLDADAVAALYAADAVAYPPNEPTVRGQDGFREYASGFVSAPGIQMNFGAPQIVVAASGDLGYTDAVVEITVDGPDGEPVTETLRDFHVWRKDANGAWRVVVDIWNSPTPLPGM